MAVVRPAEKFIRGLQWLTPGLKVKRWLVLFPIGLLPVTVGVILLGQLNTFNWLQDAEDWVRNTLHIPLNMVAFPLGVVLIVLGLGILMAALVAINRSIVGVISPEHLDGLPELIRRKRSLAQGPRIVVIGGGTGLSTLLRGLKRYSSNLTAIVTMTDDGGSSGLLQQQLPGGILPPGDIRNCLVALADEEGRMQDLFQYRFSTP
jgi:hypothetical protein